MNVRRRRAKPMLREEPFSGCAMCSDGWITVTADISLGQTSYMSGTAVIRCKCWHAHQDKLARARAAQVTRKQATS